MPRVLRYPKPLRDPLRVDLRNPNQTELVALARFNGIQACRGVPRDVLIQSLETMEPTAEGSDPFQEMRERLFRWLELYWGKFQMQAKALPIGLSKPNDMLDYNIVSDAEVVALWLNNKHQITVK